MKKQPLTDQLAALEFQFLQQVTSYHPNQTDPAYRVFLSANLAQEQKTTEQTAPANSAIPKLINRFDGLVSQSSQYHHNQYWAGWAKRHLRQTANEDLTDWIPRSQNRWSSFS